MCGALKPLFVLPFYFLRLLQGWKSLNRSKRAAAPVDEFHQLYDSPVCQQGCYSPLLETQSQGDIPLWIPRHFLSNGAHTEKLRFPMSDHFSKMSHHMGILSPHCCGRDGNASKIH